MRQQPQSLDDGAAFVEVCCQQVQRAVPTLVLDRPPAQSELHRLRKRQRDRQRELTAQEELEGTEFKRDSSAPWLDFLEKLRLAGQRSEASTAAPL